jgi:hypothetical protein
MNLLLLVIAIALVAIALKPLRSPAPAQASTNTGFYPLYIEPGVQMLRSPVGAEQVYGKVVVDLRTGKIWGFPTLTQSTYPIDIGSNKPPVSHPMFLGTFAFEDMDK